MISMIQVLALLFTGFALSRVFLRAKDKKLTTGELIFWVGVWTTLIVVVLFPFITSTIAMFLGISRGTDVVLYGSVGVLFYLIFRLYIKIEEAERDITKLVREKALEKKKK